MTQSKSKTIYAWHDIPLTVPGTPDFAPARALSVKFAAGMSPPPPDAYDSNVMTGAISALTDLANWCESHATAKVKDALSLMASKDVQGLRNLFLELIADTGPSQEIEVASFKRALAAVEYLVQPSEAVRLYGEAAALDPGHIATWLYLGLLKSQLSDSQGAGDAYRSGLAEARRVGDPVREAELLNWLAVSLQKIDKEESARCRIEARTVSEKALAEHPNNRTLLVTIAKQYLAATDRYSNEWIDPAILDELAKARTFLERAQSIAPFDMEVENLLANLLETIGNFAAMAVGTHNQPLLFKDYLKKAAADDPPLPELFFVEETAALLFASRNITMAGIAAPLDENVTYNMSIAEVFFRKSHEVHLRLAAAYPDDLMIRREVLNSLLRLSNAYGAVYDSEYAIKYMQAAIRQLEAIVAAEPENEPARSSLPAAENQLANLQINALRFAAIDEMDE